jgi:hypothetical protein
MRGCDLLTIGDLAARTGLSVSAIRFYEGRGLVSPIRTGGNQRRFLRSDIRRLSLHADRTEAGADDRGDLRRAGAASAGTDPDPGGLGADQPPFPQGDRPADRAARADAGDAGQLHRLRLSVAQDLWALQSGRSDGGEWTRAALRAVRSAARSRSIGGQAAHITARIDRAARTLAPGFDHDLPLIAVEFAGTDRNARSTTRIQVVVGAAGAGVA